MFARVVGYYTFDLSDVFIQFSANKNIDESDGDSSIVNMQAEGTRGEEA